MVVEAIFLQRRAKLPGADLTGSGASWDRRSGRVRKLVGSPSPLPPPPKKKENLRGGMFWRRKTLLRMYLTVPVTSTTSERAIRGDNGDGYENFIALIPSRLTHQMLANFLELNSKRLHQSSRKEKESCCLLLPSATNTCKVVVLLV